MDATKKSPMESPVRIRPEILAVPAYKQGMAPKKPGFKLSSNENPFETPEAIKAAIDAADVNRYAAVAMPELRAAIGSLFGFDAETSQSHVHLGAGSVSILYQLIQAVAGPGDNYIYAWPSFEGYPLLGLASGAQQKRVDLTATSDHDLQAMAAAVDENTRAVLLCSPNNPTGPAIKARDFHEFMQSVPNDVLVVLDEAYREFVTDPDAVHGEDFYGASASTNYPNLVVLRTFSKAYGLASLRIGYGVGDAAIWNAARVTGIPLSITGQAEAAALAALQPETRTQIEEQIVELISRRTELVTGLRELGYEVPDAQGNFVWLPLGERSVEFAEVFMQEGTLVRAFAGSGVRISVGEKESIAQVLQLAKAFKQTR